VTAPSPAISPERRREIVDALRRGTVPQRGLDIFAVGLDRFDPALDAELDAVAWGGAGFKAIRGEYGSGKTFFARRLQERAKRRRFATAEVQVSEAETPLHRLETVYRRAMERLSTADAFQGAFRPVIDGWFYTLEEEVLAEGRIDPSDAAGLAAATGALLESRLSAISRVTPQFAVALRGYRRAQAAGDGATAEGLIAWLAGQPHVGAAAKRAAGLKGDVDHFAALSFLRGLLTVLRDSGYAGLVLVLDEIETLQRVRGDVREKGLNALRQLIDEIDAGRFPGLYLVITGTPAFYDGPQGVRRLEPLAQRLHVDFGGDPRFDNLRAVQVRLPAFDRERLVEVGRKVRDLYAQDAAARDRVLALADDAYVAELAGAVTSDLGGQVGVVPRIFLKKLVGDVLDRIDQHPAFDPRRHYRLTIADGELTRVERAARGAPASVDDIELDL
jgi:hypothetical protein